ncbi:hypothetical protein EVAR_14580_1 [Eumeta japonica]|uniref:Uncharacterized protein n=1 Tax=Eumeta variegata TaxID=151549 RepID=A0A4C1UU89_EUMVA|nr:hypothetical protein EVAR_14580_1 [Eumeta japonica]
MKCRREIHATRQRTTPNIQRRVPPALSFFGRIKLPIQRISRLSLPEYAADLTRDISKTFVIGNRSSKRWRFKREITSGNRIHTLLARNRSEPKPNFAPDSQKSKLPNYRYRMLLSLETFVERILYIHPRPPSARHRPPPRRPPRPDSGSPDPSNFN